MEAWLSQIPLEIWLAAFLALYMAWGIGANDVANAMGTSVGSGALTLRGAIVVAATILLFALVSPENLSTNSHTATLSLAQADSGVYADSIRILPAAVEDVLTDSLSSTPSDSTSL